MNAEWGSVRYATTDSLRIGYHELGEGEPIVLLHGFPYDAHSYFDVAPVLAAAGYRVIVPYLRGHGPTTYRDASIVRSAEQAALASDVIGLLDSLDVQRAVIGGFDWGGRAACAVAALSPERCAGLVSVGGYLIQDLSRPDRPELPEREAVLWYQYYFLTERGRAGLSQYRRQLTRKLWREWSPRRAFDDVVFDRTAAAFDNPDWVETVLHNYRYRHGASPGDPRYAPLARELARLPEIGVPAVIVVGQSASGLGTARVERSEKFGGPSICRVVSGAGHNVPQEQPIAFASAVMALADLGPG